MCFHVQRAQKILNAPKPSSSDSIFGSPKRIFDKFCTESIAVVRRSGWLPKEFEFLGFFADWGLQMFSRISKIMPPTAPDRKTRVQNIWFFSSRSLKTKETCISFAHTMRKNLPKTLDQLIFCKYTLVFSKCSQIY